jgi:hypothetical protein
MKNFPKMGATVSSTHSAAQRVIVVSLQKSGTHLIERIMRSLGYQTHGSAIRVEPGMEPILDREDRVGIASQILNPAELAKLCETNDSEEFTRTTDEAWERLAWFWERRFGMPIAKRYGRARQEWIDNVYCATMMQNVRFSGTPAGLCWFVHELDIGLVDGEFLGEWASFEEPRIILNYRDPHDVMLSFVNYLSGKTGRGFGNFHEYKVFGRILSGIESFDERLSYALRDPSFPGHGEMERAYWLYRHSNVCKVSFEELVGPLGGGSIERQWGAIQRILRHLSIPVTEELVRTSAAAGYSRDAFTFYRGRIGAWRDAFKDEHLRIFDRKFGEISRLFGYD